MHRLLGRLYSSINHDCSPPGEPKYARTLIPPYIAGLSCIGLAIFVSTYGPKAWTKIIRLSIAPIAFSLFYQFGFVYFMTMDDGGDFPAAVRMAMPKMGLPTDLCIQLHTGIATLACFGFLRVIETCIIQLPDYPPRWVDINTGALFPLLTTTRGRLAYTIDLLLTIRGCSWYSDRYWDFAAPRTVERIKQQRVRTLGEFLRGSVAFMAVSYIVIDAGDTWIKSQHFNPVFSGPVTGALPLWRQVLCAVVLCTQTQLPLEMEYIIISIIFTVTGLTRPTVWPPMFDQPLMAESVADFWGNRWHYLFRQSFRSLASVVSPSSPTTYPKRPSFQRFVDITLTFVFSALLHLIVMYRIPVNPRPGFWDMSNASFYLVQPVGIALESLLVLAFAPSTDSKSTDSKETISPKEGSTIEGANHVSENRQLPGNLVKSRLPAKLRIARRLFAWAWMLWTARWWADAWVKKGLWEPEAQGLFWSPVRGLLFGDWTGKGRPGDYRKHIDL